MNTPNRQKFVHPLTAAQAAARQADQMRRETYSLALLQKIRRHNRGKLAPALQAAQAWVKDIEESTRLLEAKKRRQNVHSA